MSVNDYAHAEAISGFVLVSVAMMIMTLFHYDGVDDAFDRAGFRSVASLVALIGSACVLGVAVGKYNTLANVDFYFVGTLCFIVPALAPAKHHRVAMGACSAFLALVFYGVATEVKVSYRQDLFSAMNFLTFLAFAAASLFYFASHWRRTTDEGETLYKGGVHSFFAAAIWLAIHAYVVYNPFPPDMYDSVRAYVHFSFLAFCSVAFYWMLR